MNHRVISGGGGTANKFVKDTDPMPHFTPNLVVRFAKGFFSRSIAHDEPGGETVSFYYFFYSRNANCEGTSGTLSPKRLVGEKLSSSSFSFSLHLQRALCLASPKQFNISPLSMKKPH